MITIMYWPSEGSPLKITDNLDSDAVQRREQFPHKHLKSFPTWWRHCSWTLGDSGWDKFKSMGGNGQLLSAFP